MVPFEFYMRQTPMRFARDALGDLIYLHQLSPIPNEQPLHRQPSALHNKRLYLPQPINPYCEILKLSKPSSKPI
jgi:hypothetical protein